MHWENLPLREKISLAYDQRIAYPPPSIWEKVRSNLSFREWKFRWKNARSVCEWD